MANTPLPPDDGGTIPPLDSGAPVESTDCADEGPGDDHARPSNLIMLPGVDRSDPRVDAWRVPGANGAEGPELIEDEPLELAPPPWHMVEGAVEALLLASDGPVSIEQLDEWLVRPGRDRVQAALHNIEDRLRRQQGGLRLVNVAKGWQLRTDVRFSPWVAVMRGGKPARLSKAALETLAIIAYRQPVTKGEVDDLRGVDCGGVLRMMVQRGLVVVCGRQDEPGRPLMYGTTPEFLSMFNLRDLSDLPTLRDLRELQRDDPRDGVVVPNLGDTLDPDSAQPSL